MQKLLTVKDITELLQISYSTLYRWLKAGSFPAPINGRGKKLLWHPSQIEEWSNYRESQATTSATDTNPTKRKQRDKDYHERQRKADIVLRRHATACS